MKKHYLGNGEWSNHFGDVTAWAPVLFFEMEKRGLAEKKHLAMAYETVNRCIKISLKGIFDQETLKESFLGILGLFKAYQIGRKNFYSFINKLVNLSVNFLVKVKVTIWAMFPFFMVQLLFQLQLPLVASCTAQGSRAPSTNFICQQGRKFSVN